MTFSTNARFKTSQVSWKFFFVFKPQSENVSAKETCKLGSSYVIYVTPAERPRYRIQGYAGRGGWLILYHDDANCGPGGRAGQRLQLQSNRLSAPVTAAMSELRMHLAREKFCKEEEAREAKGTDRVHVLGLVAESLADRAMEAKKVQVVTQAANALVNMQQSDDFDAYDEDQDSQEVDNEIHAAAEGNGEYGGIHDGNQDAVIQALLDLSES